jgi:DNA-binding IscR family transcriptional regulator
VKRVTLLDVIELFEDVGPNGRAQDEPGATTGEGRALRGVLDEIDDIARATLSSITLATTLKLMAEPPGGPAEPLAAEASTQEKLRAAGG